MAKKKSKKQRSAAKAAARREKKRAKRQKKLEMARTALGFAGAAAGIAGFGGEIVGQATDMFNRFAPPDVSNMPETPATYFPPERETAPAPGPEAEGGASLLDRWNALPTLGKVAVGGAGAFGLGKLLKVI